MSEFKRYFLHCDASRCLDEAVGKVDETPSRMRRRFAAKGWTHDRYELTEYQRRAGKTKGMIRNDYCPVHAHLAKEK